MHSIASRDAARRVRIANREGGINGMPNGPTEQPARVLRKVGRPRHDRSLLYLRKLTNEPMPAASYAAHHQILSYCRNNEDLAVWLNARRDDPAFDVSHFLTRRCI